MSDNDKIVSLPPEEAEKQKKMLTHEAKLARQVEAKLSAMDSEYFDFHLFLLLFTIFKEGQADIRIKNYVNQMSLDDFDRFKSTIFVFNEFLYGFVKANMGVAAFSKNRDNEGIFLTAMGMFKNKIDELVQIIDEYNKAQGETIFRLPNIEEQNPSMFDKLKDKLNIGRSKQQ